MARELRITDASTRKVSNAVFDNWTSGAPVNWISTGSPTASQVVSEGTIQSYASAYALDIQNASTAAVRGYYQDITDLTEGQTYYISVYVKPTTGILRLYAWDGGGTANPVYVESVAGTDWQQIVVEKVAASGGIRIGLIAFDASSQGVFDLVQIATFNIEFIEGVYSSFFRVTNWEIQVPDYKGSGVFSSSPVAEGRKLIDGYWDNVTQTISFYLRGDADTDITTQNAAANKLGELFQALQAARDFSKTSWVRDPVYMQYKAENETNYRYAFITNARIPQLADQYNIEFAQLVMKDLDLIIEHPVAFGMPPGEGAPILSGVRTTFNSQDYGNYDENGVAEDVNEWVHVSSRHNLSNITNMHQYIVSGAILGSNLIGGSLPRDVAFTGSYTYFGVEAAVSDAGPFGSIIFHVSRAGVGASGNWQYYNGSTWVNGGGTLFNDTSQGFTKLGWHSLAVSLDPFNTVTPVAGLPNGYWVRFNVSGTYTTQPQVDREVFAVSRNYLEFGLDSVSGNIPALLGFQAYNVATNDNNIWRLICGLRSVDRGETFQSIINLGDVQNEAGVSVTYEASHASSTASNTELSTGFVARSTTTTERYTSIVITNADRFSGEYRCFFVAGKSQNNVVTARLSYQIAPGVGFVDNEAVSIGALSSSSYDYLPLVWDLGLMTIEPDAIGIGVEPDILDIRIYVECSNTDNFDRHSFIMIPVDEYTMDSEPGSTYQAGTSDSSYFVDGDLPDSDSQSIIGSTEAKKAMNRTHFVTTFAGRLRQRFVTKSNGPMILQQGAQQRLYTMAMTMIVEPTFNLYILRPTSLIALRPLINPRYLGMRGSS